MKKTPKASTATAVKRKASRRKVAPAARLAALAPKRQTVQRDVAADARATIRRLKSQVAAAQERIAEAEVRHADEQQTAAKEKLADIGKRLSGLKSQLAQLAEDRERERGKGEKERVDQTGRIPGARYSLPLFLPHTIRSTIGPPFWKASRLRRKCFTIASS